MSSDAADHPLERAVTVATPVFYFDLASPYSYLAAGRIDELIPGAKWHEDQLGASEAQHSPILLTDLPAADETTDSDGDGVFDVSDDCVTTSDAGQRIRIRTESVTPARDRLITMKTA